MKTALCAALLVGTIWTAQSDTFRDLDFEEYDSTTGLVPGWIFETPGTTVVSPQILTGLPLSDDINNPLVNPPNARMIPGHQVPGISAPGSYTPLLVPLGSLSPWYVRQTGEIPAGAKTLSFDLYGAPVSLKLSGASVPLQFISRTGSPLEGSDFGDISAFAGKTTTLEITVTGEAGPVLPGGFTFLDNFAFSSSPVPIIPEPRTLALSIVGALLAVFHWRFRRGSR